MTCLSVQWELCPLPEHQKTLCQAAQAWAMAPISGRWECHLHVPGGHGLRAATQPQLVEESMDAAVIIANTSVSADGVALQHLSTETCICGQARKDVFDSGTGLCSEPH